MVDVNIKGVLYATSAVLPHLLSRGHGHIVNVSSVAGRIVFPGGAVYCGTKHFVHAFSEGLRNEMSQKNIRVTTIAPGYTETELQATITDDSMRRGLLDLYGDKETLTAQDIAETIVFALERPHHVGINEIVVRPREQER